MNIADIPLWQFIGACAILGALFVALVVFGVRYCASLDAADSHH